MNNFIKIKKIVNFFILLLFMTLLVSCSAKNVQVPVYLNYKGVINNSHTIIDNEKNILASKAPEIAKDIGITKKDTGVVVAYNPNPNRGRITGFNLGSYNYLHNNHLSDFFMNVNQEYSNLLKDNSKGLGHINITIKVTGLADATRIRPGVIYRGDYNNGRRITAYVKNHNESISFSSGQQIENNKELAFLRAFGLFELLGRSHFSDRMIVNVIVSKRVYSLKDRGFEYEFILEN